MSDRGVCRAARVVARVCFLLFYQICFFNFYSISQKALNMLKISGTSLLHRLYIDTSQCNSTLPWTSAAPPGGWRPLLQMVAWPWFVKYLDCSSLQSSYLILSYPSDKSLEQGKAVIRRDRPGEECLAWGRMSRRMGVLVTKLCILVLVSDQAILHYSPSTGHQMPHAQSHS